jgi:hypothetical protein
MTVAEFDALSPAERREVVDQYLADLARQGQLYDTGERCNGQIVYAFTKPH